MRLPCRQVRLYGLREGRIRIEAVRSDDATVLESMKAYVVQERIVLVRINLITNAAGAGTQVGVLGAQRHLKIANVILRQAGVTLVPDPNTTTDPNKRKIAQTVTLANMGVPGFFKATIPAGNPRPIGNRSTADARETIRVNDRDRTISIAYIQSDWEAGVVGRAVNSPANSLGNTFKLDYRRTPAPARATEQLKVFGEGLWHYDNKRREPNTWGLTINNGSMTRTNPLQYFGGTLAHEVGHLLTLKHREVAEDGLPYDKHNLMAASGSTATLSLDLDLIQVKAIQNSLLVRRAVQS